MEKLMVGDIVEIFSEIGRVVKKTEKSCTIKLQSGTTLVMENWWWGWEHVNVLERRLEDED